MELGKPHELPIILVGTPQGATMAQGVAETVKSECQSVMDWIEFKLCLNLKRCRLANGVSLYEWRQTYECKILNDAKKARDLQTLNALIGCRPELQKQLSK